LAIGYSPSDLEELGIKTNYRGLVRFSAENVFNFKEKRGLMSCEGFRIFLGELLKAKGYDPNCKLKDVPNLGVVVSNLNEHKGELWKGTEDGVIDSVMASSAIPFMFEPHIKDDKYYVDGCLYVDCASELNSNPKECFSLLLEGEDGYDVRSMGGYLESILQGPRRDRCKKYLQSRPEGSYKVIRLDGVKVLDLDMSNDDKKKIIEQVKMS